MSSWTGAQVTIKLLQRQGIRIVCGIPGGANLPLYDALGQTRSIRHVLARHEQGAGFIAQGIARVTGSPAVCLASSGPGATNLLTAIADAKLDSVPLIAITGQVGRHLLGTDAFQEVDTYGLTIPIAKHNFLVAAARELLDVIPLAFEIAASGRPGPVVIDIPKDVQCERISVSTWPPPGRRRSAAAVDRRDLASAARLVNAASRPIFYIGGGANGAAAARLATELAEHANLPTVMSLMALGVLPVDHRLSLGMLGMHAARHTNELLDECDLLLAVGARFDDRATGKLSEFCPQAKVVHVDIDAAELNKLRPADVSIEGDVSVVLERLLPLIDTRPRREWLTRIARRKRSAVARVQACSSLRDPRTLIESVAESLDDTTMITTDVGQHQMWVAQYYPLRRARQWLTSGGLGTMGFGLPAAIGASLAGPDRTVVCFTGDGSILMNVQELVTLAEQCANVKLIVMNNSALGMVHQQQSLFYGGRIFGCTFAHAPDFVALALACGIAAIDLDDCDEPKKALRAALRRPGPGLIHSTIDVDAKVFPMVPPGAANRDMIEA